MLNFDIGEYLKVHVKPPHCFIDVSIKNAYNTIDSLSYFFYNKKHEWIAICFLDFNYNCQKIYFEKGKNNSVVIPKITTDKVLRYASKNNYKNIIIAHNHTVKPFILSVDGKQKINIGTGLRGKRERLRFSEGDKEVYQNWLRESEKYGISLVFSVVVAGEFYLEGYKNILRNISYHKPIFRKLDSRVFSK